MSDSESSRPTEQWGSKLGVILAVAGSAVGLGNFLRFPGQAAANGGGAFMIPYFISFLIVGIPICWAEWTMGRYGGKFGFHSSPGIFSVLWRNPLSKYIGSLGLLIPVVIYMYYVYIESWCLAYAFYYATGDLDLGKNPASYSNFFTELTGQVSDGAIISGDHDSDGRVEFALQPIFWFFLITFVVNFYFIYRGLSKGIERFCKFAMPLLILAAIGVAIRVLTLPEQPLPEPWPRSLPQALPTSQWDTLKETALAPKTTPPEMRKSVVTAFNHYFDGIQENQEGYDGDIPVLPPVGFANSDQGMGIAMGYLRAGDKAEPYVTWLHKVHEDLSQSQKLQLQDLERSQTSLVTELQATVKAQTLLKAAADHKGAPPPAEAMAKFQEDEVALKEQLKGITAKRKEIIASTGAGAMPSLLPFLVTINEKLTNDQWTEAQERYAALEVARLRRTVFNGLGYMWNPDLSRLFEANVWLAAAGQIFFSLSIGFGIILTYASYLRRDDDVVLSGLTASSTNEFCEVVLGGLVAIPSTFLFLGMASTISVIEKGSTFGLGFNTLPAVFANMPAGRWIGMIWFGLLFLAGITSSLSMLQPAIAFLEEGFNLKRRASVSALGLMTLSGALTVIYFSHNVTALDTMDFWVGTFAIFVLATIEVILFGWVIGIKASFAEAHRGADMHIPRVFGFILKFVTPVFLLTIFAFWLQQNFADRVQQMFDNPAVMLTVLYLIIILLFMFLLISLAAEQWRKIGLGEKEVAE
ncbi:Sodium:neurotransmitter symporter family protein [Planctomycetes bacterium Pan216]|uniref:Sodium:neurotransmitter symporter family protein n=1 Tax=Kolteria novifilia TaxID=2527975 RepID=A0A518B1T4_9BACT|nr:Sodium:neurotransmitter symporter family protein [Planctomycetes bacterium Pan216]